MQNFFDIVSADLKHYLGGTFYISSDSESKIGIKKMAKALLDIDFRVVFLLRLSMACWNRGWRALALLLYYRLKSRHHIDIHPSVDIGAGVRFVHAFCIVIGAGTRIGTDVVIFGQALMGKSRPDLPGARMPVIGDHVLLGAGCRVLGAVHIPSYRLVPANSVVTTKSLTRRPDLLVVLDGQPSGGTD